MAERRPLITEYGITLKELRDYLNTMPEDYFDGEGELWVETGWGLTSPVFQIGLLNRNDLCIDLPEHTKDMIMKAKD